MSEYPIVRVRNAQRKLRVAIAPLAEFARRALRHCCDLPASKTGALRDLPELSVVLVSDRRIAALHRKFMNVAGATDVLTFQHGEIIVSVETARRNAARFGSSTVDEIRLYMVHGFLHLLGFDDKSSSQIRAMKAVQDRILRAAQRPNDH